MSENAIRVRFFHLSCSDKWIDDGIGQLTLNNNILEITAEDSENSVLLSCSLDQISTSRQSESIILIKHLVYSNYALSFQQVNSAIQIWKILSQRSSEQSSFESLPEPSIENLDFIVTELQDMNQVKTFDKKWLDVLNEKVLNHLSNKETMHQYFIIYKYLILKLYPSSV